jgi:hypothetical protein
MSNFCLRNRGFTNRNNSKNHLSILVHFLIYLSKTPLQRPKLYNVELNTKLIADGRQVRQNEGSCFKVLTGRSIGRMGKPIKDGHDSHV